MKDYIKINSRDNVVVALKDLCKGQVIDVDSTKITLLESIGRGHKISIKDIKAGEDIIKYGYPIGHALVDIFIGQNLHTHNVKTNLNGVLKYSYEKELSAELPEKRNLFFRAYRREDNQIGIRNELWIVPTVGCVNGIGEKIIQQFKREVNIEELDSVQIFKHNYGCSQLGEDHENTRTILADIVKHPNAGGVLVLGLGCENNYVEAFKEKLNVYNEKRIRFLIAQEVYDEINEGVRLLKELYDEMKKDKREEVPLSELKVGLKCGGSDGFSGITANPLLGAFSDYLIGQGGSTILTEVPEMFGAETILMKRAKDEEVFNQIVDLVNNFKKYFTDFKQPIYENPSPGNKAGGITTLEEKSLGCTQKGGSAEIAGVLKYGEVIKEKGLRLLNAPGNDLVAATALAASGCQMVLFTTGRGTPFGTFVPTIKVSTNTEIYKLKPHWIDFDAGVLLEDRSMEDVLEDLISYIVNIASGEEANNERNDFREISVFKTGVTL